MGRHRGPGTMVPPDSPPGRTGRRPGPVMPGGAVARRVVDRFGGRFSTTLGIDVDAGDDEVERWFVAATLFGTRISATLAGRTFHVLDGAGLRRIADASGFTWDELVALLDTGGYARYDFRTASRLHTLADAVHERAGGSVATFGSDFNSYPALRDALDDLPGWGPVTVGLFLRELRTVWPGACPPLDPRAEEAARHLRLYDPATGRDPLGVIARLSDEAGLDARDVEGGLVRLWLAHRHDLPGCPGGAACTRLAAGAGHPGAVRSRWRSRRRGS